MHICPDGNRYGLDVDDGCIVGDPSIIVGNDVGHMINDYCSVQNFKTTGDYRLYCANFCAYIKESSKNSNVINDGSLIFAWKDIKSGDELHFSYGLKFWIGNTNVFKHYQDKMLTHLISLRQINYDVFSIHDYIRDFESNIDQSFVTSFLSLKDPEVDIRKGLEYNSEVNDGFSTLLKMINNFRSCNM